MLRDRRGSLGHGQDVGPESLHRVHDALERPAQPPDQQRDRAEQPDEQHRDDDGHRPLDGPEPTRLGARHRDGGIERGRKEGGGIDQLVSSSALRPITRVTGTVKTIPWPGRSRFPQISWIRATARSTLSSSTTLKTVWFAGRLWARSARTPAKIGTS